MLVRSLAGATNHRSAITLALLGALLLNLFVAGYVQPPDLLDGSSLPMASRCQGGGPGCAEQPMIPPPAVGIPEGPSPVAPAFGEPALLVAASPLPADDPPPVAIEHPPELASV